MRKLEDSPEPCRMEAPHSIQAGSQNNDLASIYALLSNQQYLFSNLNVTSYKRRKGSVLFLLYGSFNGFLFQKWCQNAHRTTKI